MKYSFFGVTLFTLAASAFAGGSASVTCTPAPEGVAGNPVLNISYSPNGDAGSPGMIWVGVLTADQSGGAVLNTSNNWMLYSGGLYPPNQVYYGGIPSSINISVPFPNDATGLPVTNTSQYVGYSVYIGHGIYTQAAADAVASRRSYLNSVKPQRLAAGTWLAGYDDDTQYQFSLVQKYMVDSGTWGGVLSVPFVDCAPPPQN